MKIGYIGLGKMGKNMVLRLLEQNHEVVAWNRSPEPLSEVAKAGAIVTQSISELVEKLSDQRIIWVMLPAGDPTQDVITKLENLLDSSDIVINGANEHYKVAQRHAKNLEARGIEFIDAGVSGGPSGARNGACVMIGGKRSVFEKIEPLFAAISAPKAYQFFDGVGAGHFVKMVHNSIEYGMMQALAEGYEVLKKSEYDLDLELVSRIYNNRSVIESRLVDWVQHGYEKYGIELDEISGVAGSGGAAGMEKSEAKWTVDVAKDQGTQITVIEDSINARLSTQETPSYQGKFINMLRNQFGGHSLK